MFEGLIPFERSSNSFFYLKLAITILLVCKSIQVYQTRPMKFYYSQTNKLMKQFMEESKIKGMTFKPHLLLLWHACQTFCYLIVELFN